MQHYVPTSVNT